jgi:hypothetical protein
VEQGYPESGRDDAPTWIASASLRAEVLGEWPHVGPARREADEEEEPKFVEASFPGADPWTVAALPAGPVEEEVRAISVVRVPTDGRTARYSLDPLGDPVPRRRFGRARSDRWESIEVAARPSRRAFPGSA